MKIVNVTCSSHFEIAIEPILEVLSERGHEIIKYDPDLMKENNIYKDVDVVLLTSNSSRPINLDKHIRTYFIPHGLGLEMWEKQMNCDTQVFLAGMNPWIPPKIANNWKIVGWAKTDALFNPKKERVDYVNNLMANLPYDKSILCIPTASDLDVLYPFIPEIHNFSTSFLVDYFDEQKINIIAPYRELRDAAINHFKNYKHMVFPEINNLYYFAPHIELVICVGPSSVGREFYITKIPSIYFFPHFTESLYLSNQNKEDFVNLFSTVWDNPNLFIQPNHIIKNFFGINDGKVVERIIKEIEI